MGGLLLTVLLLGASDPEVGRVLSSIATTQGDERALAVQAYTAGCHGKNRFAFRNNKESLEALRPTFKDFDRKVRMAALSLTACYPPGTFATELLSLLEDKDDEVKERAFEEAAHAQGAEVLMGVATHVEGCLAKLSTMSKEDSRWCVFALYALGEGGKAEKDPAVRKRVTDLSLEFIRAPHAKLREHAVRNVELCGTAANAATLESAAAPGSVPDDESKRLKAAASKLKKKKK